MLRYFATFGVIGMACAYLVGCGGGGGTPTQADIDTIIAQVRDYTAKTCAFLPDATNIAAVVAAFVPQTAPFTSIAVTVGNAICTAYVPRTASLRKGAKQTRLVATPRGVITITGRKL